MEQQGLLSECPSRNFEKIFAKQKLLFISLKISISWGCHNLEWSECIEWTLFSHSTIILFSSKGLKNKKKVDMGVKNKANHQLGNNYDVPQMNWNCWKTFKNKNRTDQLANDKLTERFGILCTLLGFQFC